MSKFEKSQRVNVPGLMPATQAVILDVTETVTGYPVYALRWLTPEGETLTGSCGEGDLAEANFVAAVVGEVRAKSKAKGKR